MIPLCILLTLFLSSINSTCTKIDVYKKGFYVEGLKQEIEQTQDIEYFIACQKNHINKCYIIVRNGVQSTHTY